MSRKRIGTLCLLWMVGGIFCCHGADTNSLVFTNRYSVELLNPPLSIRPVERYQQELIEHQGLVFDRFGPISDLEWARVLSREGYGIHDRFNSVGANSVLHLLGDSARETAVAVLPIDEWQGFGHLLLGTIGNTSEERTRSVSAAYSETAATSWEETYRDGPIQVGVRPWRTDPYAYCRVRVGHWGGLEDLPLFALEARVGYKLLDSSKVEGRLVVPLSHHFQFAGGIGTDPMRLCTRRIDPTVMSGRLEYIFNGPRHSRVMYLGAQSGAGQTLLATGFLFAW